jgi:hypothetical protein
VGLGFPTPRRDLDGQQRAQTIGLSSVGIRQYKPHSDICIENASTLYESPSHSVGMQPLASAAGVGHASSRREAFDGVTLDGSAASLARRRRLNNRSLITPPSIVANGGFLPGCAEYVLVSAATMPFGPTPLLGNPRKCDGPPGSVPVPALHPLFMLATAVGRPDMRSAPVSSG